MREALSRADHASVDREALSRADHASVDQQEQATHAQVELEVLG